MGNPRKQRKKYSPPNHMWRTDRIEEENNIIKTHGLKNKREIWRAKDTIARIRRQAIKLQAMSGEEADKEKNEIVERLTKMGMLKSPSIEAVLLLNVEDLLERRLQTMVFRKGIAYTPKQARQLIVHGHIVVGDNVVTIPRYPVKLSEEESIKLKEGSSVPEVVRKVDKAEEKSVPEGDTPQGKEKKPEESKSDAKAEDKKPEAAKEESVKEEAKPEEKTEEAKPEEKVEESKPAPEGDALKGKEVKEGVPVGQEV